MFGKLFFRKLFPCVVASFRKGVSFCCLLFVFVACFKLSKSRNQKARKPLNPYYSNNATQPTKPEPLLMYNSPTEPTFQAFMLYKRTAFFICIVENSNHPSRKTIACRESQPTTASQPTRKTSFSKSQAYFSNNSFLVSAFQFLFVVESFRIREQV